MKITLADITTNMILHEMDKHEVTHIIVHRDTMHLMNDDMAEIMELPAPAGLEARMDKYEATHIIAHNDRLVMVNEDEMIIGDAIINQ